MFKNIFGTPKIQDFKSIFKNIVLTHRKLLSYKGRAEKK